MVKEKRVELIELFSDLIYVYAISRLSSLLTFSPEGGFPLYDLVRYFILFFVILQAWLYMTNYVNRYGEWTPVEYGVTLVNMIAAMYLSNTISVAWENNYIPFNIAMLVMLGTVAFLYYRKTKDSSVEKGAAENSLKILGMVCAIYILGILCIIVHLSSLVLLLDVIAVLVGAFLPFLIRGNFDASIISFPHLAERFELLTIIMFGQSIVDMSGFFRIDHFTLEPILIFMILVSLFGTYVLEIHQMMDHHRVERSLRLMFSHYLIVISINLLTAGIKTQQTAEILPLSILLMIITGIEVFHCSVLANDIYCYEKYKKTKRDMYTAMILQVIGIVITVVFYSYKYIGLIGLLCLTGSEFALLLKKYMGLKAV